MSIVSGQFILFLAVLLCVYFVIPKRYQWILLLVGSYIYYLLSDAKMIALMMLTTATVFLCGKLISATYDQQKQALKDQDKQWLAENKKRVIADHTRKRKRILLVGLLLNLGILAFIKYYGFVADNINAMLASFSWKSALPEFDLLLPLGISFYTFQSLGYLIDVYRGKYAAEQNPFRFALFVSFFPQIIQGPISRFDQLAEQLYAPHDFDYSRVKRGVLRIGWGFFKKLVIADRAAIVVQYMLGHSEHFAGLEVAFGVVLFMIQIYADFSGGMDIALGVARAMGIEMVENFRRPHFAVSISDYWRRWHITLGAWMKDYLLYSLSLSKAFARLGRWTKKRMGNRWGRMVPSAIAMWVVFMAVGIWHGADWKFIIFGVYNGLLIVFELIWDTAYQAYALKHPRLTVANPWIRALALIKTLFLVFIGKYFSMANSAPQAFAMLKSTFTTCSMKALIDVPNQIPQFGYQNMLTLVLALGALIWVSVMQEKGVDVLGALERKPIAVRWLVYYAVLFSILLLGMGGEGIMKGFMYANF